MERKPRKVRAKITRTVTEIAIITLTRGGDFDEYVEFVEEIEMDDVEIHGIRDVISEHD